METFVIASSSIDGGIGCWDLNTGKEHLRFKSCASRAHCLTAVGEKYIAASQINPSSYSGSIFYWSWDKPQVDMRRLTVESIRALAANREGTYIVGGGASGRIYIWEVNTGKLLKKWHGHVRSVTCLVFCGDDSMFVSGSQDGSLRVWSLKRLFDDFQTHQGNTTLYEHSFHEHRRSITDIVVDYVGGIAMMVSTSEGFTCKVWNLSMGTLLKSMVYPSRINALALDPGRGVFFAGGKDGKIYINAVNADKTDFIYSLFKQRKAVTCLAHCAVRNLLISGSEDGVVHVWNAKSLGLVRTFVHGKGPVNNIQVVKKTIVANLNKKQSSWKRVGSSMPLPLEKYERLVKDPMDGIVAVDPLPCSAHVPVYSPFLGADLIDEQVKELQQQGSAATEIKMERLNLENKRCLQICDQWQKNFEILLPVVMEEQNGGSS